MSVTGPCRTGRWALPAAVVAAGVSVAVWVAIGGNAEVDPCLDRGEVACDMAFAGDVDPHAEWALVRDMARASDTVPWVVPAVPERHTEEFPVLVDSAMVATSEHPELEFATGGAGGLLGYAVAYRLPIAGSDETGFYLVQVLPADGSVASADDLDHAVRRTTSALGSLVVRETLQCDPPARCDPGTMDELVPALLVDGVRTELERS